jgi:hypothetical protein
VVFNGATPEVGAILARIREDYSRWRQTRLFRSDSFGLVEPLPLLGGELLLNLISCHLLLAALCRSLALSLLYD